MTTEVKLEPGEMLPVTIDGWGINPQEMTGLRQAITQAIRDSKKKDFDEQQKENEKNRKNFNVDKKDREKFNKKLYEQLEKVYVLNKGGLLDQNKRDKARAEFYKIYQKNFKGLESKFYNMTKIATLISQTVTSLLKSFGDSTSKRFAWLQELEKSGVKLSDGFDAAFTTLANDAKLSHDMFTKLLVQNSKHVARMNSLGMNGAKQLAGMSGKIMGKFGLSADQASGVLQRYMENVEALSTDDSLRMKDLTSNSERYIKSLKGLATATGKSIELIMQENQIKEDSIYMAKVKTQYPQLYEHLHEMGLSDAVIKAIISGRQNDESIKMFITAGGRAIMDGTRNLAMQFKRGQIDENGLRQGLYNIGRSSAVQGDINSYMNADDAFLNALESSEGHNYSGMNVINYSKNSRLDLAGANKTISNEGDTGSVNALENYRIQKNKLANRWNEVTSISTGLSASLLNVAAGFTAVGNAIMGTWIGRLIGFGTNIAKTPAGIALGGWIAGKFIKNQLIDAIAAGIKKARGSGDTATSIASKVKDYVFGYNKNFSGANGIWRNAGKFVGLGDSFKGFLGSMKNAFTFEHGMIRGLVRGIVRLLFGRLGIAVAGIGATIFSQDITSALGFEKGSTAFKWINGIISTVSGALSGLMIGGPVGAAIGGAFGFLKGIYNAFSSSGEETFSPKFDNGPAVTNETKGALKFLNGSSITNTTNNYNGSNNSSILNTIAENTKASARAEERRLQHEQFISMVPAAAT